MTAPTIMTIATDTGVTGQKEISILGVWQPDAGNYRQDLDIPYASLMPAGETRPLKIYRSLFYQWKPLPGNVGFFVWVIESPADSEKWKIPLAYSVDGQPPYDKSFTLPLIFSSTDTMCIECRANVDGYNLSGFNFNIHGLVGP